MKATISIDGGHLRVLARKARHDYDPDFMSAAGLQVALERTTPVEALPILRRLATRLVKPERPPV